MLKHHSSNIHARLSEIERILPGTIHMASFHHSVNSQIEQLTAAVAYDKVLALRSGSTPAIMCANNAFDTSVVTIQSDRIELDDRDTGGFQGADWESCVPQVGTLLDRSPNFSPAMYTACGSAPPLIITAFWQTQQSRTSRTNHYHILFSKSPNVYQQLTVSIEFHATSKYWAVSKISKDQYQCRENIFLVTLTALPQTLQDQVWQMLAAREILTEQTHVNLAVTYHGANGQLSQASSLFRKPMFHPRSSTMVRDDQYIITNLEDLGCTLYQEGEVQSLASFEPPNRFVSIVAGSLVEEVRSTRSPPYPTFLYALQAFHCLNGVPGVLSLLGVVVDSTRKHIRSYLLELPRTKCELFLDYLSGKNNESWEDQENWAHRLIEAVRQIHSKGYTIGTLQRRRLPILVDTFGTLYLSRLEQITVFTQNLNAVSPPEFQRDTSVLGRLTPEAKAPRVTPKFDIYQLGSCLWVLAQSWAERVPATQAYFDARERFSREHCTSKLPPLSTKVPAYYRELVEACRRDDPSTRPSASQLLAMLPQVEHNHTKTSQTADHPPLDVPTYLRCRIANPGCDICKCVITGTFYHCNTCAAGDYDICKKCFGDGEHCLEDDHLLVELENSWKCPTAKKYISCVRTTGLREVVEM